MNECWLQNREERGAFLGAHALMDLERIQWVEGFFDQLLRQTTELQSDRRWRIDEN
jgi:hypothetical protein